MAHGLAKQYKMHATFSTHRGGPALTHTLKHPGVRGAELNHSLRVPTKGHVGAAAVGGAAVAYGGYKTYQHFHPNLQNAKTAVRSKVPSPVKTFSRVRRKR